MVDSFPRALYQPPGIPGPALVDGSRPYNCATEGFDPLWLQMRLDCSTISSRKQDFPNPFGCRCLGTLYSGSNWPVFFLRKPRTNNDGAQLRLWNPSKKNLT